MTVIDLCSVVAKKVATKVYCDSIIGIELSPYTVSTVSEYISNTTVHHKITHWKLCGRDQVQISFNILSGVCLVK